MSGERSVQLSDWQTPEAAAAYIAEKIKEAFSQNILAGFNNQPSARDYVGCFLALQGIHLADDDAMTVVSTGQLVGYFGKARFGTNRDIEWTFKPELPEPYVTFTVQVEKK